MDFGLFCIGIIFIFYGILIFFVKGLIIPRIIDQMLFTIPMVFGSLYTSPFSNIINIILLSIFAVLIIIGYALSKGKFSIFNSDADEVFYKIKDFLLENKIEHESERFNKAYRIMLSENKEIKINSVLGIVGLNLKDIYRGPI